MNKQKQFLEIFKKAQKHYASSVKRLAADGWDEHWKVLIATIMSAQTRDEVTIPIAEKLFARYNLNQLARAKYADVLRIIKPVNFSPKKAKFVIASARKLVEDFTGEVPREINELVKLPGVGRKTANLVVSECHNMGGICVDTHVHRISNVFGFVKTKTPDQTEMALRKLVPRKYWSKINRVFVLWGQDVRGRDRKKFLNMIE